MQGTGAMSTKQMEMGFMKEGAGGEKPVSGLGRWF